MSFIKIYKLFKKFPKTQLKIQTKIKKTKY